jgi:hypothetical protein
VVAVADSAAEVSRGLRGERMTTGVNLFRKYRSAGPAGLPTTWPLFLVRKYWGDDTRGMLGLFVENAKSGTRNLAEKDYETLFSTPSIPSRPSSRGARRRWLCASNPGPAPPTRASFGASS